MPRKQTVPHPVDSIIPLARARLRKAGLGAPATLNGTSGAKLIDLARRSSQSQPILAAKALYHALRCKELIRFGDASEAARHSFLAAWHYQTRRASSHNAANRAARRFSSL